MKKSLFKASTALLLILSMTACSAGTTNQAESQTTETAQEEITDTADTESAEGVDYGNMTDTSIIAENLELMEEWDKVFPLSDEVNHRKVTFVNHFGITLAADLYEPKEYTGKLAAIAVCGPFRTFQHSLHVGKLSSLLEAIISHPFPFLRYLTPVKPEVTNLI